MKTSTRDVLKDMSEQDYQAWKRHPVSQVLFEHMEDRIVDYRDGALQRWEQDAMSLTEEKEILYRIKTLRELGELKLADIKYFYTQLEKVANE